MLTQLWRRTWFIIRIIIYLVLLALFSTKSVIPPSDLTERVRFYTRDQEFNYLDWTIRAFWLKFNRTALGLERYLSDEQQVETVMTFIDLTRRIQQAESEYTTILADPAVAERGGELADVRRRLDEEYALRAQLGPLAESILQVQVLSILQAEGITTGGQSIPPVLYHMTSAPMALIVSPRDVIRQEKNISVQPEMTIDKQVALEDAVAEGLDVSTLVVPIGGIGLYPTMVTQTSNINWLAEVVSHEWAHNYFSLHPLGLNYLSTPELRTMNETAAAIFGKEIGRILIEKYYPEQAPPPKPANSPVEEKNADNPADQQPQEPVFDFRAEMRETRINADRLLGEGKIDLAEQYMELRRRFFWDNGYRLRKLNQAYFAFYGAYADVPGGAAGDDPVAAAVRDLWAQSDSLRDFMSKIAWMSSVDDLQQALGR